MMKTRMIVIAVAMTTGASVASADETRYSGTFCEHIKSTLLQAGPELTVFTSQGWGVQTPQSTFEPWAHATVHCMGYQQVVEGKGVANGACQWTDATGDTFTGAYRHTVGTPGVWKFLGGTGKWKGIEGSGAYKVVSASKPAKDGTVEVCLAHHGKYTLPK
jgi:hypothetical protein